MEYNVTICIPRLLFNDTVEVKNNKSEFVSW